MTTAEFDYMPHVPQATCPFDPPTELIEADAKAPMCRVQLPSGQKAWLVTGYDLARKLLTDQRLSVDVKKPGFPVEGHVGADLDVFAQALIRRDEPDHMRLRQLVASEFRPSRVEALTPMVDEVITDAIARLREAGSPADLIENFALAIPTEVTAHILGVPSEEFPALHKATAVLTNTFSTPSELAAAMSTLADSMRMVVKTKLQHPQADLLSSLCEAMRNDDLSFDELISMAVLLVVAGYETTANTIGVSLAQILLDPALKARLTNDEARLKHAAHEFVRFNSVVRGGPRRLVMESFELDGLSFTEGEGIIFSLHTSNRNTGVFGDAGQIDVHRPDVQQHVAFGFGMHQCMGKALALKELERSVHLLLTAMPTLEIAEDRDALPIRPERAMFGLDRLMVTW